MHGCLGVPPHHRCEINFGLGNGRRVACIATYPPREPSLDLEPVANFGVVIFAWHDSERIAIDLALTAIKKPAPWICTAPDHDTQSEVPRSHAFVSVEHDAAANGRRDNDHRSLFYRRMMDRHAAHEPYRTGLWGIPCAKINSESCMFRARWGVLCWAGEPCVGADCACGVMCDDIFGTRENRFRTCPGQECSPATLGGGLC